MYSIINLALTKHCQLYISIETVKKNCGKVGYGARKDLKPVPMPGVTFLEIWE